MHTRENFEKSLPFGDLWHIFMQLISCSESIIFQQAKTYNFENELVNELLQVCHSCNSQIVF